MFSWTSLLEASVTGGICIILFFLVSMLCGERYRARYKKIVWLLIALQLCIPINLSLFPQLFTIPLPVFVLGEGKSVQAAGNDNILNTLENMGRLEADDNDPVAGEEENVSNAGDSGDAGNAGNIGDSGDVGNTWNASATDSAWNAGDVGNGTVLGVTPDKNIITINIRQILVGIWICVSFVSFLCYLLGHVIFYRRIMSRSEVCRDEKIMQAVSDIASQMGLKHIPQIRIADKMEMGPFTIGIFRNKIILPNASYEEKSLYYVIRHELAHCAGKDVQFKVIFVFANIIHWFNPLVWLMKTLVDQDLELACDEKVLADSTRDERKEYSEVIMSYVTAASPGRTVVYSGYAHDIKFLKKRFNSIFDANKKSGKIIGCALAVLLVLVSGLIGFETGQTAYAKENAGNNSFGESDHGLTGYGDFSGTGIFQGFFDWFFNGDSYSSTDSSEYMQFDGFRGYSTLSIFPETVGESEVINYSYQYRDTLFDPTAQIYLECRYGEDAYQAEITRLQGIFTEYDGEIQTPIYDTENFVCPAYVTINGNNHCYEYALLLGDGEIAYVFLQFADKEEVVFSVDYLPKAYEERDKGYSMYIFYRENGDGVGVY